MPVQVVFDIQSVRLEISKIELRLLKKGKIPSEINRLLLEQLQEKVNTGEGIIENWEERA